MNKIQSVRRQMNIQTWTSLIKECQSSGMKVLDWCRSKNISKDSYYYWLKVVREANLDNASLSMPMNSNPSELSFRKLEVSDNMTELPSKTGTAVVIHIGNVSLDIQNGVNQLTLEAVLKALETVC